MRFLFFGGGTRTCRSLAGKAAGDGVLAHVPSGGVPKPGEDIPQEDRANSAELLMSSPCARKRNPFVPRGLVCNLSLAR